jgi:dolichyl-phosphate-mannose--protein O-mannosyl transferase
MFLLSWAVGCTVYFDIHPPLGKLVLAYGGYALGFRPDPTFVIEKIGHVYPPTIKFVALRIVSAVFSVATVPLTYIICRALDMSKTSSTFTATQVLTDLLGTIEGRLVLMDSQLFVFCQLTMLSALQLWRTTPGTPRRWIMLAMTGLCAGLALSIKHTALATPALVALVSLFGVHFLRDPLTIVECAFAGSICIAVYVAPFYPFLTRYWTTGDKYDKFWSGMPQFTRTVVGSDGYDANAVRPPFWKMFLYLNKRMLTSNAGIKKRHSWESDWFQWILSWRGVLYYSLREPASADGTKGMRTIVYLIANPVVIVLALVGIAVYALAVGLLVRTRKYPSRQVDGGHGPTLARIHTCAFLLLGWICNLAPYVLIDRAAFLYHYLPGLFYAQLLSGVVLDMFSKRVRIGMAVVLCAAMIAAFVFWAPWVYALPLTDAQHAKRRILPRWN